MNRRSPLLHVIGAGPWQVATIRRAKEMGCRVLATDGSTAPPGFELADLHASVDITDADATLIEARKHGIDAVLCDTTDNGVLTAAHVASELGLPGITPAAARRCTDKALMTACAAAAGLRVPKSHLSGDLEEALGACRDNGPWVVKPVDNQSGRGVSVVQERGNLKSSLTLAFANSRRGQVLIQERVAGLEVIVDSLVVSGVAHRLGVATKTPYADNPTIASRITYGDAAAVSRWIERLDTVNRRLIQALGLHQGLVHAEYMLCDEDVVPIDVAARGGGVHIYSVVLPHVSGVDTMRCAIELALGKLVSVQPGPPDRAANIEFLRCRNGLITGIHGLAEAAAMPGVAALHLNRLAGQSAHDLLDKDQRLGHVVTLASSPDEAVAAGVRAAQAIDVQVNSTEPIGTAGKPS